MEKLMFCSKANSLITAAIIAVCANNPALANTPTVAAATQTSTKPKVLGVLGGGQLGRM